MRDGMDDWLKAKMDQDLMAMTEEREKLLKEAKGADDLRMPACRLEEIHREIEIRSQARRRNRLRKRTFVAVALVAVLCIGMGAVSSGKKVYVPEILHGMRGDEVQTKIENTESIYSEYDEEEVLQEIEDEMGVLPIRFEYRPDEMRLVKYWIEEDANDVTIIYETGENEIHVYISKDYDDSSISYQTDGEKLDIIPITASGLEVEIFKYVDPYNNTYFAAPFEYLNTYYLIVGMMDQDEFEKIIENIVIKNV